MVHPPALKAALKRGALLTAANWPLVAIQFIAQGLLKLLLAVPVVGGVFLVVLLLGADAEEILAGDLREILTSVFTSLRANPAALAAFAAAFLLALAGGSALTFMVKGGTVSILAKAEADAGAIERPPLRVEALRRARRLEIEPFLAGCRRLGPRYLRLGGCLLLAYVATGVVYLVVVIGGFTLTANVAALLGWTIATALASGALLVWITLVNLVYLLTQMVIAIEDIGVRAAARRVGDFLRTSLRDVAGIFGVVLLLVGLATIASILATAGLGLIAFVPLAGLAVVPLQFAAWLLRGFVFEYLALTALTAYLTQYRHYAHGVAAGPVLTPSHGEVQGKLA
ncbi:MAG: hypothetical protein H0X67_01665 [Acidobacteria bacterium]|nr:hypothetical protein [Acidobacteriota bacterium]